MVDGNHENGPHPCNPSFRRLFWRGQAFAVTQRAMLSGDNLNVSIIQVQADCFAVGQDKAAEMGGTLAKAKPATRVGLRYVGL